MNNLSARQNEVAELVAKGLSNKEVATKLNVTEKTVKFHLTNIFKILEVKSRTQLALKFLANDPFLNELAKATHDKPLEL